MSFPATTQALKQLSEATELAKEFKYYANGVKKLADSKAFASQYKAFRDGLTTVKKTADTASKTATNAKKITDLLQQGAFKKINPSWGSRFSNLLAILNAGATTLLIKKNQEIQEANIETQRITEASLSDAFTRTINNSIQIRTLQKTTQELKQSEQKTRDRVYGIEKQQVNIKTVANNALYEVRQGRKILESKISEQATNFRTIKVDFDKALKGINTNFQTQVSKTITDIQTSLKTANSDIQKANEKIFSQSKLISDLQAGFKSVQGLPKTIDIKIEDLKQFTIKLVNGKLQPVEIEQKTIKQDVQQIKTNGITKQEIDGVNATLRKTYEQSFEAKAQKWNEEIQKQNEELNKKVTVTVSNSFSTTTSKIGELEKQNTQIRTDLDKLNTRLGEQEKVNKDALPKLDQLLGLIPLIPAKTANFITPHIPTKADLENAAATGTCRTTQPGGCSRKMMDDAINSINANSNQKANNILDAINTGAHSVQLNLLNKIDAKLGVQLPGGLSGTFGRLWQVLQVDRVISTLTLITTMHNAAMLSSNIFQTLFSAFDNISQSLGFKWKNEKGEETGFGGLVSEWTSGFFKTIFGETTYNNLNQAWNAANRFYQATTNMLWNIQGMFDSMRSIVELAVENTGKIGNALKKAGAIFENAFPNMPEHVTARTATQKKWDDAIENLGDVENVVSAFASVTGEVVSIGDNFKELKTQREEFLKSKDDAEKAVTALINGEKDAAKVNQAVTKEHTQKAED